MPKKFHKISIVLSDALGVDKGGVDWLVDFAAKELHEACRALVAEATVVLVGTIGRSSATHHHTMQFQLLAEQHGRDLACIYLNERVGGLNVGLVHLEADTAGDGIESGVGNSHRACNAILADEHERVVGHCLISTIGACLGRS